MMKHHGDNNGVTYSPTPAEKLAGQKLQNRWKVENPEFLPEISTGGTFSIPYIVNSDTEGKAFLKAMDYASSFANDSVMDSLYEMIQKYRHERDLLQKCAGMSRIVRLLDCGETHINTSDPFSAVHYLIFELADSDIRAHVGHQENTDFVWTLQMMHQTTVGLQQLHTAKIAHLDIKPSNVLVFGPYGAKLSDLGRSIQCGSPSPFDNYLCAGDSTYAPPELLYGKVPTEWKALRFGCDLYMLGSLVFFLTTGSSMTPLLLERIDKDYHPRYWTDTYDEVLPYVQNVFSQIIQELRESTHTAITSDITEIVKQLCDPCPEQRGLPINKGVSRYSLQKFISKFDLLYKRNLYSFLRTTPLYTETQP